MLKVKAPKHDWIQVKPVETETPSGLVLPNIGRRPPKDGPAPQVYSHAIVLAHGPGGYTDNGTKIPMVVEVGDLVLFSGTLGVILVGMKKTWWMRNGDVVSIIEEGPDETDLKEAPREIVQSSN